MGSGHGYGLGGSVGGIGGLEADRSFVALYEQLAGSGSTPSRHLARREAETAMKEAIARLPEVYARVVRLVDLEDRPVRDVARELGRSIGAVYMLRTRAHERLRRLMGTAGRFFSDSP